MDEKLWVLFMCQLMKLKVIGKLTANEETAGLCFKFSSFRSQCQNRFKKSTEWTCLKISSTAFPLLENNTLKVVTFSVGV